jgi:very-short-patch-repair endonuclease
MKIYICKYCQKKFDWYRHYIGHLVGKHRSRNGIHPCMTPESIKKMAESIKNKWINDQVYREKTSKAISVTVSKMMKKRWEEPEYRRSQIEKIKAKAPSLRERKSKATKKLWENPEYRERKRKQLKQRWSNEDYREYQIKAMRKFIRPNKSENKLLLILSELCPNEWKYVGNGDFIINGKNPDFVNVNGKKLIIELFGDYWHKGQDPNDRIEIFKPFGFDTLVIWEKELKEIEILKAKIRNFMS